MINTEETRQEFSDFVPYKRLAQAIILQAIKDYAREDEFQEENQISVRTWVRKRAGTFDVCAIAWDRRPEELQEIMTGKMDAIDCGESLRLDEN